MLAGAPGAAASRAPTCAGSTSSSNRRSFAYVFADPPYGGEGIQYGELSALWGAWLEPALAPRLADEIGENPVHGRSPAAFAAGLAEAFAAVRRALVSDGRLTVTFASSQRRELARAARRPAGGAARGRRRRAARRARRRR